MPSFACIVRHRPNPKGRGEGGSRKKVKSGGRQIGTIRVVAVRVGVEFVTGLWISQTNTGDRGQRIQAGGTQSVWTHFWAGFFLSFFYALLGPNGKHIYLPDCHWVVCWVHCVCHACACVCVCVSHSMQIATGRRPDMTGICLPWRTVARSSLMLWSCPCPLVFERHSFKVPQLKKRY